MRAMIAVVLCLEAILSSNMGAHAEPYSQSTVPFAAPGNIANKGTGYLLGSFKAGLTVTLITETGICRAKTGATFSFEHMGPDDLIEATRVVGVEECRNLPLLQLWEWILRESVRYSHKMASF